MGDLNDLETRIQVLEDVEAIKKLKARYYNTIDRKLWIELADCFSEDGVWVSERRKVKVEGAEAKIGDLALRDSIIMAPMGTKAEPDGGLGPRSTSYYVERAQESFELL